MVEKLKKFFDDIGCPAVAILRTPRAGDEVDNGCGVDFDLPEYAVIHDGNIFDKAKELGEWRRKNNIDFMYFCSDQCKTVDSLIKELGDRDDYEVKWRR